MREVRASQRTCQDIDSTRRTSLTSEAVPHNQGRERQDKGVLFCKLYSHYISYLRNLQLQAWQLAFVK